MKKLFGTCAGFLAAALLAPNPAEAQPILTQRCNADSLDPSQATARLNWARRCALRAHAIGTNSFFDTETPATSTVEGFSTLQDYHEDSTSSNFYGHNAYSGQADSFEVNYSFITKMYNNAGTSHGRDSDVYFTWWRTASKKKLRPLYPTFGTTADINSTDNKQLWPSANANNPNFNPPTDDCRLLTATGVQSANFYINGFCESSCYTPEQTVLFSDGYTPILDAVNARRSDMVILDSNSSLDNILLKTGQTYSYTAEFRDTEHPIVELKTESGGMLRVTTEHPIVDGSGRLVTAKTLHEGDQLVKSDGTLDRIVSVTATKHFGKVYNLRPNTSDRISNLLVAEGYVVGSSLFQNDEVDYINRVILNKSVPAEVIP